MSNSQVLFIRSTGPELEWSERLFALLPPFPLSPSVVPSFPPPLPRLLQSSRCGREAASLARGEAAATAGFEVISPLFHVFLPFNTSATSHSCFENILGLS